MADKQSPSMPLLKLVSTLDPAVRRSVRRRFEAMIRELSYIKENRALDIGYLKSKGWSVEKLEVVLVLNSVYQIAIGPLHSSARSSGSLGLTIPILHGTNSFDKSRSKEINKMESRYATLVDSLGIRKHWLMLNTAGDVIYWIERWERKLDHFPNYEVGQDDDT